mmetsp:Transcript_14458/g.38443  ORF Transcript_14458/g.38443 Transcript_14458/m.38443 type:complete len:86 (+) Transcript_14458:401-658(+)
MGCGQRRRPLSGLTDLSRSSCSDVLVCKVCLADGRRSVNAPQLGAAEFLSLLSAHQLMWFPPPLGYAIVLKLRNFRFPGWGKQTY